MTVKTAYRAALAATTSLLIAAGSMASAAPVLTPVNVDLATTPFSFSFMGGTFSLTGTGDFPNYLSVSTDGGAAVRTVFGQPSTDFPGRGSIVYDENILGGYSSLATPTVISPSNGENFLGLRVTSGGQNYFGFLYTSNTVLNGYGFETTPGTGIVPTTSLSAAVPEPATWGMMVLGFGAIGFAARRSRRTAAAHA